MPQVSLQDWPQPDAAAIEHSLRLIERIKQRIDDRGGDISFADYMQMALYEPGLGYYVAGASKFGAQGDFVTAPEISSFFSCALSRQAEQIMQNLAANQILEFGAGRGVMARDVLLSLQSRDALPEQYFILELSPDLKQRQQATLADAGLQDAVTWLDQLPDGFAGVVLANEILDAMPVERCRVQGNELQQQCVVSKGDGLALSWRAAPHGWPDYLYNLPNKYVSEWNPNIVPWIAGLSNALERGVALLIDYGFPRTSYYRPDREDGTLMCHYRHLAHADALVYPGLQDITASVDFTAVAEAAVAADLQVSGYSSQAAFLIGAGLELCLQDALADNQDKLLQFSSEIKRLTLPSEMGERFQVMALSKNYHTPLSGFTMGDQRHHL